MGGSLCPLTMYSICSIVPKRNTKLIKASWGMRSAKMTHCPMHDCSITSCNRHAASIGVRMEVSRLVRLLLRLTCPYGHKTLQVKAHFHCIKLLLGDADHALVFCPSKKVLFYYQARSNLQIFWVNQHLPSGIGLLLLRSIPCSVLLV